MTNQTSIRRLSALVAGFLLLIALPAVAEPPAFVTLEGGVKARTLAAGHGPAAEPGMIATIHFVGWLDERGARGAEFINSHRENHPISFLVGTDKVMPAWNAGVIGMQVGEKRMLLVPPAMGFGARSVEGRVPPNSPLMLQIELIKLEIVD